MDICVCYSLQSTALTTELSTERFMGICGHEFYTLQALGTATRSLYKNVLYSFTSNKTVTLISTEYNLYTKHTSGIQAFCYATAFGTSR